MIVKEGVDGDVEREDGHEIVDVEDSVKGLELREGSTRELGVEGWVERGEDGKVFLVGHVLSCS